MVIDDDLDTLRLLDLMLIHQGYQLVTATSGEQAFGLIEQEKPKLVLLDMMMPGMDGIEVARRLRSSPTTKDILIVVFSAMDTGAEKLKGFAAGVDDYLVKPIHPRELIARLRAVLQHSSVESLGRQTSTTLKSSSEPASQAQDAQNPMILSQPGIPNAQPSDNLAIGNLDSE